MEEEKRVEENHENHEHNEHKEEPHNTEHHKINFTEKIRENPWILSTIVCGILALVLLTSIFFGGITGNVISAQSAAEKVLSYYESAGVEGLTFDSVKEVSGLYEVSLEYQGSIVPIYITKDGKSFTESLTPTGNTISEKETQTEIPKSEKPIVELFVMSYCPYGTQAEKGMIPVVNLLGDKINFKLRFVDYLMHGDKEAEENLREYCIQKLVSTEKFLEYMTCFLEGDGVESNGYIMNGNNPDSCIAKIGIDKTSLNSCITNSDKEFSITENLDTTETYPRFNVEKELNEEYGVAGSPTLIINGVEVSSSRDPASYLEVVCSAFTESPEECTEVLSSSTPSAYFGWESSGSSTTASCE